MLENMENVLIQTMDQVKKKMLSDRWKRFDLNQDLKDLLRVHAEWVCGRIQISLEGHGPDYEKLKKEISVKDDDCINCKPF